MPTISGLDLKVLAEVDRENLEKPFNEEEVSTVVNGCDGNKALGPDGLNLNFVKANWVSIKDDFMNFIKRFKDINNMFIALFPKCGTPESLSDYRPIRFVNSTYKILANVLANRLKTVMGEIINECQSTFVRNRHIMDSFVVAEEMIHSWKRDKEGGLVIKLDFEKAYHNGLNCLIEKATGLGLVSGATFGTDSIHITHLQFADDTVLYFKPKIKYLHNARRLLRQVNLSITYLGLPFGAKPFSKFFWDPILKFIDSRMAPWKKKFLNKGGSVKKKKAHAINWKTLCKSKNSGGLGIGSMSDKNKSLLVKWIWRFGLEDKSLWRLVTCAKYGVSNAALNWDWKDGKFTVSSFRNCLEDNSMVNSIDHKFIWQGLSPPKTEFLLWQPLRGRVMVRKVLYRFGYDPTATLMCSFCGKDEESIDHLFLHCQWSWNLWTECMN
ncbi:hypothetical protein Ddye_000873 [Dipteronia dyeriana]|uniref:Reverse transcriptase domain-containing protein n=1 Tax=Dipteronia dyeriana TaxID=168575 RepID=A0AAD9XMH1_9ROSI|nr:hypothetical protein Ddye_000873 [Dipteronia dyeriana]